MAVFIFRSFISPLPLHVRNHSGARNKSRFALLVVSCWCGCLLFSVQDVVIRGLSHITGLGIGENNHSNQIQITFNLLFLFSSIPHLLCSFCFFSKVFSVKQEVKIQVMLQSRQLSHFSTFNLLQFTKQAELMVFTRESNFHFHPLYMTTIPAWLQPGF